MNKLNSKIKGHMMDGDSGHIQAETTVLFDNSVRVHFNHPFFNHSFFYSIYINYHE